MLMTRRSFVGHGAAAFTFGVVAPRVLCDAALAQGLSSRNLVVVYLGGGNDSLSMLIPYKDAQYYSRRPTLAVPAGNSSSRTGPSRRLSRLAAYSTFCRDSPIDETPTRSWPQRIKAEGRDVLEFPCEPASRFSRPTSSAESLPAGRGSDTRRHIL
jgi:uncharacterized protein (DUF1501 family)